MNRFNPVPHRNYNEQKSRDLSQVRCFACGTYGHTKSKCPQNPSVQVKKEPIYKVALPCDDTKLPGFVAPGTVNGTFVDKICRDTGCTGIIVADHLLPDIDVSACKKYLVLTIWGG